jgi:predicted nucleotidyltransferase
MADDRLMEALRGAAMRLFPGRGILVAYAYGSRVSGHPLPESDLDVGYYPHLGPGIPCLSLQEEMLLEADLSDATGVSVDLRCLASAPLELRGRVLEEGVRIYSSDDVERVALECEILSRYHDRKQSFERMHELRLRRVAHEGLYAGLFTKLPACGGLRQAGTRAAGPLRCSSSAILSIVSLRCRASHPARLASPRRFLACRATDPTFATSS